MKLIDYIEAVYGYDRGNKAAFLKANPRILPQELSRWLKAQLKINPLTGEIYKPVSRTVSIPDNAVLPGALLSDWHHTQLHELAKTQNVSPQQLFESWLTQEDLRQRTHQHSPKILPEQEIASLVSQHFATLTPDSEVPDYHQALRALMRTLMDKDYLTYHVSSVAESERLTIPRTAYYWYGGAIAKRVAQMFGTYDVYLWHEYWQPNSEVVFVGEAQNVVVSYFVCQQLCRLIKQMRSQYRKQQGSWGTRTQLDDIANEHASRFVRGIMESPLYIGGGEADFARLFTYVERRYAYTLR